MVGSCFRSGSPPSTSASSDFPHSRQSKQRSISSSLTTILGSLSPSISRSGAGSPQSTTPGSPESATFLTSVPRARRPSIFSSWSRQASFTPPYSRRPSQSSSSHYTSSPNKTIHDVTEALRRLAMASNQLLVPSPLGGGRLRQEQKAKEMEKAVQEKADRLGLTVPPYEFLELIGKGSFGRVFKSRQRGDDTIVAVKIIDVDRSDYGLDPKEKDQAIKDFINETSVLQQLKDSKAKNVNSIFEAFAFHSQLWIVSEYCPGGSVHTLMKATNKPGLEEKYIVAICRELALALKHVHEIGVIHRDIKAANILITEDGQLQLCDFGVSGVLESGISKRSTIIGTPFWMAPEMHNGSVFDSNGYGTEIDCWAYGCTVFELATGLPPNARIDPSKLGLFLQKAPRLEGDYSAALKDFVSFCLVEEPEKRPAITNIINHAYIANTEKTFPTSILKDLIQRYAMWERGGGQRHSLFNAHGAMGPGTLDVYSSADEDDEWNFSTSDKFADNLPGQAPPFTPSRAEAEGDEATPKQHQISNRVMTPYERAQEEERITRAGNMMGRLFSNRDSTLPYTYGQEIDDPQRSSDLPLRNLYPSENDERKSMIDLDDAMNFQDPRNVDLADVPTVRAKTSRFFHDDDDEDEDSFYSRDDHTKRATREWTFPSSAAQERPRPRTQDWTFSMAVDETKSGTQSEDDSHLVPLPVHASRLGASSSFRPTLKHTATEPIGNFGDYLHPSASMRDLSEDPPDRSSMIDLDESFDSRPSTSHSTGQSSLSDFQASNPFDLVDPEDLDTSTGDGYSTIRATTSRTSLHAHTQSAPSTEHPSQSLVEPTNAPLSVHGTVESMRKQDQIESSWEDTDDEKDWDFNQPPPSAPLDTSFRSPKRHPSDPRRVRNFPRGPMGVPLDTGVPRRRLYDPLPHNQSNPFQLSLGRHPRRGRSRTERTPEGPPSRALGMGIDLTPNATAQLIEFPDPMPPAPESLEENADPAIVAQELQRLLGDLTMGLRAARQVMRNGAAARRTDSPNDSLNMKAGKKKK